MPKPNHPISSHPGKPARNLRDAANDGMILELRCNLCRRYVAFLARDLIEVCGPTHPLHLAPFGCTHCATKEYVRVKTRVPNLEEYGRLPIRRPVMQVWKWRTGLLGE